jgi:parallel beta-helix repeat protein
MKLSLTFTLLLVPCLANNAVAATVAVNCDAGGKIQTALNTAQSGDTILISGICNENISIRDELARITIDGQGTATINAPSTAAAVVTVLGRNITIKGFTITGGRAGFNVLRGGSALIDTNTIQDSVGAGILVLQNGHARIINNTIQFNPNSGITVQENSNSRIGFLDLAGPLAGNVIQRNGVAGVILQRGGVASLVGNTISENDGPGVLVSGASHGDLSNNHIDRNASDGVLVTQNSDVQLGGEPGILNPPNETTVPNGGFGLRCSLNASVDGSLGTLSGVQGVRRFDSSCSNGPKIQ